MPRLIDMTGNTYGRLVVVCRTTGSTVGHTYWKCKCECGNVCIVDAYKLRKGITKSCGCSKVQYEKEAHTTHGLSHTRLHNIWMCMIKRCSTNGKTVVDGYGGRGITVCSEWLGKDGFLHFKEWALSNGYKNNLTIDRIDNNGIYSPENCRWATAETQANNKRNNVLTTYRGEQCTAAQLSKLINVPYWTCLRWIKKGMSGDEIEKYEQGGV